MFDGLYISAFGIGCGLTGSLMLARGILTGPNKVEELGMRAHEYGSILNVRAAEDWADATAGVAFVTLGFMLQGGGLLYPVSLGVSGMSIKIVACTYLLAGGTVTYAFSQLTRWYQIRWYLIKRAHYYGNGRFNIKKHSLPSGGELIVCGIALGKKPRAKEEIKHYMKRVWKLEENQYKY